MKRAVPLIALALVLATFAIHARIAIGHTWDDVHYHTVVAPPRLAAGAEARHGMLPRWWEGASWGVPLVAEPSHGAADPVLWLARSPHALDLLLVLHVAWLALGVALWARRAGSSDLAVIAAGVLVATTGIVTSAALRGALPGLADVPWVGWAALGLARAQTRRASAIGAILVAAFVATIGLAGELAAVIDAIAIAIAIGGTRTSARWLAAGLAAGVAIACVQWAPAFALHAAGQDTQGIGLARLVELVVPGAFGSSDPARAVAALGEGGAAWPSLFVGAPLVALALAHRHGARMRWLVIGTGVLALVVGRGGWPAWLGAAEVHAGVLVIVLAVRAARGVDALVAGERRARIALGTAAAVAAVATWCMVALRDPTTPGVDRALVDGSVGVACMVAAIALMRWRRLRFVALALAIAPSAFALRSTSPTIHRREVVPEPTWVVDGLAALPHAPRRMYRPDKLSSSDDKVLVDAVGSLAGTSADRWGIDAVRTDDPARLPDEEAAWTASAHGGGQLLERFGVGLAVLPLGVIESGHLHELDRRGGWGLVQYPSAPPAVTVSDWTWVADPAAAFKALFPADGKRGVSLDTAIVLGSGPTPDTGGIHHATTCTILRWDPGAIDLSCAPPSGAYALATSSAADGWTVDVDRVATPWVVADGLRRAVYLTRGTHELRWRYRVPGLAAGLVLAALGIALLGALGWLAWRN